MTDSPQVSYSGASAAAIRSHYDLGNAFYRAWLDPEMVYSAARFTAGETSADLPRAQFRKLDYFLEAVVPASSRGAGLLDVGFGWGACLRRARDRFGVQGLTGLSLSPAQTELARETLPDADLRVENWFDHRPESPYDAILSIEAFEAFARPGMSVDERIAGYRKFFDAMADGLVDDGRLGLQFIAYGTLCFDRITPLIGRAIFPESDLPRLEEVVTAAGPRFEILSLENDRDSYVKTLRQWGRSMRARRADLTKLVGERRVDEYLDYVNHSMLGFASEGLHLYRMILRRRRDAQEGATGTPRAETGAPPTPRPTIRSMST